MLSRLSRLSTPAVRGYNGCPTLWRCASSKASPKRTLEPYPREGVLVGVVKGEQVDFVQNRPIGERLITWLYTLPQNGGYLFQYRNIKDFLESDAVSPECRQCFQLKYIGGTHLTDNLLAYLYEELAKRQDPFDVVVNRQERYVAKLAVHYHNMQIHKKKKPLDRAINRIDQVVFYELRRALLAFMKMDFKRADWLVNELRIPPSIDVGRKGPFYNRYKPRDPQRTILYYKKMFMRLEKKKELFEKRERAAAIMEQKVLRIKRDAEVAAAAIAAG